MPSTFEIGVQIVADHEDFIPKYKTPGSACCDLVANLDAPDLQGRVALDSDGVKFLRLGQGHTVKIDCGFSMALPPGFEAQVRARSGFGAKGIICPNGPGTIDEDYRGRMCVLLTLVEDQMPYVIKHKDRIAQIAILPTWRFDWQKVEKLDDTERGAGAFGSTGKG